MNIDWMNIGKKVTEGVEHEFVKGFNSINWEKLPCKTGFSQGYAFKEMIREFNLAATHVGETHAVGGAILGIRTKFSQGVGEVFAFDDGSNLTMLAVRKFWEE